MNTIASILMIPGGVCILTGVGMIAEIIGAVLNWFMLDGGEQS